MAQKTNNDIKLLVRASLLAIRRKVGRCRKASLAGSFVLSAGISLLIIDMADTDIKVRKITLGSVVSWIVGLALVLIGAITLATHAIAGILFLLAAFITLPPSNKLLADKLHISLSGFLKFFLVIILAGIGIGLTPTTKSPTNDSVALPKSISEPERAIVVTANKLMADYEANEVAADAQYKNKLVEVTGTIKNIGKDVLDTPYVSLSTNSPAIVFGIQCMFEKSDQAQLATLSKNQKITLRGRVSSKLGNVLLQECSLVK